MADLTFPRKPKTPVFLYFITTLWHTLAGHSNPLANHHIIKPFPITLLKFPITLL